MAGKPLWLLRPLPDAKATAEVRQLVARLNLRTVCVDAGCPNLGECWAQRTATFMILGKHCTRRCGFCKVLTGRGDVLDPFEPWNVAQAVRQLKLRHAVITSVTRDDLEDGGAAHFAATIRAVHQLNPETSVEVLIPDFKGEAGPLKTVLEAGPEVLAHNIETVERLQRRVRPQGRFGRSLEVLRRAKEFRPGVLTKSSIMLGLGETPEEVREAMVAVREQGVDFFTIGQYLRPSKDHLPVERYVPPEEFEEYRRFGLEIGFKHVAAGPLVRSSYDAARALHAADFKVAETGARIGTGTALTPD
ncbi:MAG: lipoyl synthase [Limnochordales bacterium]|nr:lipoyl synthase [Limnochordales bacterium]